MRALPGLQACSHARMHTSERIFCSGNVGVAHESSYPLAHAQDICKRQCDSQCSSVAVSVTASAAVRTVTRDPLTHAQDICSGANTRKCAWPSRPTAPRYGTEHGKDTNTAQRGTRAWFVPARRASSFSCAACAATTRMAISARFATSQLPDSGKFAAGMRSRREVPEASFDGGLYRPLCDYCERLPVKFNPDLVAELRARPHVSAPAAGPRSPGSP